MSVINQMLQDLERRHAGPEERRALPDEVRPLPAVSDRGRLRRAAGWSLAVAGAAAVAWVVAAGRIDVEALRAGGPATGHSPLQEAQQPESVAAAALPAQGAEPASAARPAGALARVPVTQAGSTDGRPRPARADDASDPGRPDGARQARREAANVETARLVRDAAVASNAPAASPSTSPAALPSTSPAASAAVSPAVAANFAAVPGTLAALAPLPQGTPLPAAAPPGPAAAAGATAAAAPRPGDASPARIDRQEREPNVRERTDAAYRRGIDALHEGRQPLAEQALREALALTPGHEPSRQALLGLLVQQRRNADAEALLAEGLRLNPQQTGFAMALARLQAERGDNATAIDTLQRAAAAGRDRPEFLGFHAGLLARAGRPADAAAQYRAALRLAPQNAVWWMGLGIVLESDRRPSEAAEAFQRARELPGLSADLVAYVDQRLRNLQR